VAPELHLSARGRAAALGAGDHATAIHAAGMAAPDLLLHQACRPGLGAGMVLLHPHLAQLKAGGPQGPQQLMAVVLQGLQPGPRLGPHR
jgi:hypothetical protein